MRVILDCDPGNGIPAADIDDGLALGFILKSPEFKLEAVTIAAGNSSLDDGVRCGLWMLETAGVDVPLYRGTPAPLLEDPAPWRAGMDGRKVQEPALSMWHDVPRPVVRGTAATEGAAEAIVRIVNANPGEITIIAVGPLTNVARAIMIDPTLPEKLAGIAIMGGAFGVKHRPQELNFGYDPEAAQIVVTCGARIILVPLDTTLLTDLTLAQNERLSQSTDPLTKLLGLTCAPWIKWVIDVRGRKGCPLHDPLAVAALIDPSLITLEEVYVDVELAGRLTRARPVSWLDGDPIPYAGLQMPRRAKIQVATGVDSERFVALMLSRLTAPA